MHTNCEVGNTYPYIVNCTFCIQIHKLSETKFKFTFSLVTAVNRLISTTLCVITVCIGFRKFMYTGYRMYNLLCIDINYFTVQETKVVDLKTRQPESSCTNMHTNQYYFNGVFFTILDS